MPVAVEVEFAADLGRKDYEQVLEGLALEEFPPEGLLSHVATERDGRIRVLEVWESRRHYRAYREDRLVPNIEYALGNERAALTKESIRTEMPVRGFVGRATAAA